MVLKRNTNSNTDNKICLFNRFNKKLWSWRAIAMTMAFFVAWDALPVYGAYDLDEGLTESVQEEPEEAEDNNEADLQAEFEDNAGQVVQAGLEDDKVQDLQAGLETDGSGNEQLESGEEQPATLKLYLNAGDGRFKGLYEEFGIDEKYLEIYASDLDGQDAYTVYLVKELSEEDELIIRFGTPDEYTDSFLLESFPEPELGDFEFLGWFTDKEDGELVTQGEILPLQTLISEYSDVVRAGADDTLAYAPLYELSLYAGWMDLEIGETFFDGKGLIDQYENPEVESDSDEVDLDSESIDADEDEISGGTDVEENGTDAKDIDEEIEEKQTDAFDADVDLASGNDDVIGEDAEKSGVNGDASAENVDSLGSSLLSMTIPDGEDADGDNKAGEADDKAGEAESGDDTALLGTPVIAGYVEAGDKLFSGKAGNFTTNFQVYDSDGKKLSAGKDYDKNASYSYAGDTVLFDGTMRSEGDEAKAGDIVPPGTVLNISVNGVGNYEGSSFTGQFMVVQSDISKASFRVYPQYYTGDPITPDKSQIELKVSGTILGPDDYEILGYDNNVSKGTGKIYVRGAEIFGGEKTLTFSIVMPPTKLSVIFNGNGSTSGRMSNQVLSQDKTNVLSKNKFARKGYVFKGWNTEPMSDTEDPSVLYEDGDVIEYPDHNIILYAQWQPEEYNITYYLNGGINHESNVKTSYTAMDEAFRILAPEKENWPLGYQFGGWFKENTYKTRMTEVRKGTTGDISLYALWIPYNYTVTFDGNGATSGTMENQAFSYGLAQTLNVCKFAKKGSVFMGWALSKEDADAHVVSYLNKETVTDILEKRSDEEGKQTLYAVWQDTFDIIFEENGGTEVSNTTYTYGNAMSLPSTTRRGYSFGGWFTDDGTFKKQVKSISRTTGGDLTLFAKWNKYSLKVSFNGNGSTSGKMTTQKMAMETDYSLQANRYARKGYEFLGWSFEKRNVLAAGEETAELVELLDGETALTAQILANMYLLHLVDEGVYESFEAAAAAADPLKKNNQTVTLYAVWRQVPFQISYHFCGGMYEGDYPESYCYGDVIDLIVPYRDGARKDLYTFAGWYLDPGYKKKIAKITATSMGDLDLFAKWTMVYDISFDPNPGAGTVAGSMPDQKNVRNDVPTAIKANAFKNKDAEGEYAFLGWAMEEGATVPDFTNKEKVVSPQEHKLTYDAERGRYVLKLYAVWKQSFEVQYKEIDDTPLAVDDEYLRYTYLVQMTLPKNVEKPGYVFGGWYSEPAFKKKYTSISKGSIGDKTFYARWTPKTYAINFEKDAPDGLPSTLTVTGKMSKQSFKYTTAKALPKNAYKLKGFTFMGWSDKPYAQRADGEKETVLFTQSQKITLSEHEILGMTLYPVWSMDTYSIIYNNTAGTAHGNPDNYTVVTPDIILDEPQKLGDTFLGWYKDSKYRTKVTKIQSGSTGTLNLYAKWANTRYTLCYNLNAGDDDTALLDTSEVGFVNTYDQKYSGGYRLATATRNGFAFGGWYKDARCKTAVGSYIASPYVNMTVYARWIPITYSVHFDKNDEQATGTMKDMTGLKYGTEYKLTANSFKKNYYDFAGWKLDSDAEMISYANTAKIKNLTAAEETITLYATWTPGKYQITYYVNGGSLPEGARTSYSYGDAFNLPVPTKKNAEFLGWCSDSALKVPFNEAGITAQTHGNIKVYAKWKFNVLPDIDVPDEYLDVTSTYYGAVANDGQDDREAFLKAIRKANENVASGGITTIYVPAGNYDVAPNAPNDPVIAFEGGGNIALVMDRNAIINVGGTDIQQYSVISIKNADNVTVQGGKIVGDRSVHQGTSGESGHGLGITGSRDITIYGMEITDNWGDGIYLGTQACLMPDYSQDYRGCNRVTISNCEIYNNRRNNISLVDADNVVIDSCHLYDAHGTAPQCGIYVEPNSDSSDKVCEHIKIMDCLITAYQNKNHWEYMVFMTHQNPYDSGYTTARDILIQNCTLNGYFGNYSGSGLKLENTSINGTYDNWR